MRKKIFPICKFTCAGHQQTPSCSKPKSVTRFEYLGLFMIRSSNSRWGEKTSGSRRRGRESQSLAAGLKASISVIPVTRAGPSLPWSFAVRTSHSKFPAASVTELARSTTIPTSWCRRHDFGSPAVACEARVLSVFERAARG